VRWQTHQFCSRKVAVYNPISLDNRQLWSAAITR